MKFYKRHPLLSFIHKMLLGKANFTSFLEGLKSKSIRQTMALSIIRTVQHPNSKDLKET